MVRYLFYTIGDLTYQSPLVCTINQCRIKDSDGTDTMQQQN